jgi:hypothetical protein
VQFDQQMFLYNIIATDEYHRLLLLDFEDGIESDHKGHLEKWQD